MKTNNSIWLSLILLLLFGCIANGSQTIEVDSNSEKEISKSLKELIEKTESSSVSERVAAFEQLRNYWYRKRSTMTSGFSDTAPKGRAVEESKPALTDAEIDAIAGAIKKGFGDSDEKVCKAAAKALSGVPRCSESVLSAIEAGINSSQPSVIWYVEQQRTGKWPKIELVIDMLIHHLASSNSSKYWAACDIIQTYGDEARPFGKRLIDAAFASVGERRSKLYVLCDVGMTQDAAKYLMKHIDQLEKKKRLNKDELGIVALSFLEHPDLLKALHKDRPELIAALEPHGARLFPFLCKNQHSACETREWLISLDGLSPNMMAMLGNRRFLDQFEEMEKDASAYRRTFLAACKRACGGKPDSTIKVDSENPVSFRPKSAWPESDERRKSKDFNGHADGAVRVIVTGQIRTMDGAAPQNVQFFRTNDSMLMGSSPNYEAPLKYDPVTGRFVFRTSVFAAYSMGEMPAEEPGPYQTGSAQIRIEASGCEPLVVQFFDEMPDVEITLDRK